MRPRGSRSVGPPLVWGGHSCPPIFLPCHPEAAVARTRATPNEGPVYLPNRSSDTPPFFQRCAESGVSRKPPPALGDVSVGLLAPFVATAYARSSHEAARRVCLWNQLGIADLVIAVTLGFLTSPSPLQLASFDRPSVPIGIFPLSLIPVYMVPLSILLHLASLRHLRHPDTRNSTVPGFAQLTN
jgi:hypothetical protein